MELLITEFVKHGDKNKYYGSVATHGENAGPNTFNAAKDDAPKWDILNTSEKIAAAKKYFKSFGAWDEEEIASWSIDELNALMIQCICAEMSEETDSVFEGIDGEYYISIDG